MKTRALPFSTCLVCLVASCFASPIAPELLDLPVDEFNAPGNAWRVHVAKEDFRGAGELLEAYLQKHGAALPDYEFTLMHFHTLQMLACMGDTSHALSHVEDAKLKPEPADWPLRWNDYVDATAAFLRRDRAALAAARERIVAGPKVDGRPPNLDVVDRLLARFDETYRIAYGFGITKRPNQSPLPTPGKCPPSNHDQPPRAADH